jgi:hypothetical protein
MKISLRQLLTDKKIDDPKGEKIIADNSDNDGNDAEMN